MNPQNDLEEFRAELHAEVCSRCVERRPGGPPCGALGKECGIERHLPALVELCRTTDSALIDPYIEKLHDTICADCDYKDKPSCPCPLDYLLQLAVETVEKVQRRQQTRRRKSDKSGTNFWYSQFDEYGR
jgi:hypothetical protein